MDKSKSNIKPTQKTKTETTAKFFVQKPAFFGTVKKILDITKDALLFDSLNNDPKQHEEILFQDILSIKSSPNYETEFTIINKKHESTQFFCANRARCLSEIYTGWDNYIQRETPGQGRAFTKFNVSKILVPDNHELYIEVDLIIFRTHLELVHKSLKCPPQLRKDFIDFSETNYEVDSVLKIPFYSIGRIYKIYNGIIIEMRYSQAHQRLLLYDLEKTNQVINTIQKNYGEFLGRQVLISSEDYDDAMGKSQIVRPKVHKLFFFNAKVYKVLESGHFFAIEMAISDDFLIEYDINTGIVIQKFEFSFVKHVVRMMSELAGVQVIFDDSTRVTYVPLRQNRGLLASTIFTLASWKRTENVTTIQDDFIHGDSPKSNHEVLGWMVDGVELDYEIELIQKFTEPESEEELYGKLHEFNLNAVLKNYAESDPRPLQNLMNLFGKYSRVFLTEEFMAFWDVYQVYLANLYPFDFVEKPLVEDERQKALEECHRRFTELNDEFHKNHADKGMTTVLNVDTAPVILYKAEELLKGIIILITSGKLFREIAVNKSEQKRYENFMLDVVHLIDSPFTTLSHLAGSFFRALCRFPTLLERKNESINKKFVITSRVKLIQKISETLAKRVLIHQNDQIGSESQFILSILACLRILKTFVYDRKETTNPEDFQVILQYISTPYYFAIFNFLSRYRSLACVYDTTIIINSFFQHCTTRELYRSYQEKFLNNSTLILLHIKLVLSSLSVLQRKISVVLLTHLLQENSNAIALICRIFPKNLFRKVDFMSNDISKWTLAQWEQFFSLVAKNFDTPIEQWTDECREELLTKLQKIDSDINQKFNYCPAKRINELFDPSQRQGEFLLNIRWNHEEFEMNYEVLEAKILVWKYYLRNLLEDGPSPKFTVPVTNPAKLWNELNIRFTGSTDDFEMRLLLKVMVLLYREQNALIRDLNTMQYWLRCLATWEYRRCRYLILQLFYTSLSVDDVSVMRFNIKKFVDIGGLKTIADVLSNLYFSDDHNSYTEEALDRFRNQSLPDMDYNYTALEIQSQAYTDSLEKKAMIKIIINIYKSILYRPIDKSLVLDEKLLYPIPVAKYQIIEPTLIRSLMSILLLKDDEVVLEILEFFNEYLCDKFTFSSLTNDTPLFEYLLYNVTPKTTVARFKLAQKIYQRITEDLAPEENAIKIYAQFSFKQIPSSTVNEAIEKFPLFRYLPKYMIWRLITAGYDDVAHIYWADSFETPEMIWSTEMRNKLSVCISEHIAQYRTQVIEQSEKNEIISKEKVPKYTDGYCEVVHQNLLEEVSVGPMWLRAWIKKEFKDYEMSPNAVPIFIDKLSALLKHYCTIEILDASPKKLSDLLIVLKGFAKAIKSYSIGKSNCFKEVIGSLGHFSLRLSQEDVTKLSPETLAEISRFILVLCRLIFRAIRLEKSENPSLFIETNGIETIFNLLKSMLKKICIRSPTENEEYYSDLNVTFQDLKILNLLVQIFKRIYTCYPSHFIVLDPEKKLQFFLNLQTVSKIPLILLELNKTRDDTLLNEDLENKIYNDLYEHLLADQHDQQFDTDTASIFEIITSEPKNPNIEIYTSKILTLNQNLIELLTEFSLKGEFATSFIQAGLNWRFLEFLTYYGETINTSPNEGVKLNSQAIVKNLESICNLFRNNVIFSNEAYIWKLTGGFTSRGIGIITSKEKSAKVIQALNKIDNSEKLILANFHDCVMNVLGKHILQLLLMDYYEPSALPGDKDKQNVQSFLKVYSTALHDPATLWNMETRQELKNLLINQIFAIKNSHGRLCMNLIEKFRYSLHIKHLIISDVFISLYNKTPEWKIANPPQFLLKTMKIISDLWQNLQDLDQNPLLSDSDHNLSSVLFNLNEATAAIYNVITNHGFEDVLLSEESLTQLGFLLSDKILQRIRDPYLATLKSTCLDIFMTLSGKLSGSLKLLENASILQNIIELLRSNTKESSVLNRKIVRILEKVAEEDSFRKALINYGFFVFIFESCLKTEIHPTVYRKEAFAFVVKVIKNLQVNHLLNKLILTLFPYNVQEKIYSTTAKVDDTLEMIDIGYDTPKTMWTKLMRHEVLLMLSTEADLIQEKWSKYEAKEIRITDNIMFWSELQNKTTPVFPELEENLVIDHIYLKNFNKEPIFDENDNPAVFIDNISNKALELYDEFINKTKEYETSNNSPSQGIMSVEDQRQLDKLSCQMVTLLTSLMLSLDQLINGIKSSEEKQSIKEVQSLSHEKSIANDPRESVVQGNVFVSETALGFIIKCLELFNHLKVHPHILSTELQLIFLIIENERGFNLLKNNEIISVLAKMLKVVADSEENQSPFTFVEEKMILSILIKITLKDQDLTLDGIKHCSAPLKKILLNGKEYLRLHVENAISVFARNPSKGKEFFTEFNKGKEVIGVETIYNSSPFIFIQHVWKSAMGPYKNENVLKKLVQKGPDNQLVFPVISDFSVISIPHPKGENLKAEQNIKQHITRIMNEYAESPDS